MLLPDLTPSQVSSVREEIDTKTQKRDSIQPVMDALIAALATLATEKYTLSHDIELAAASIAPIRKLPLETLSIIFEFCALNEDEAPLTLQKVSRKWRAAAASPGVWSRIVMDLDEDLHDDGFSADKVELYLEKSRDCMLDVVFHRRFINSPVFGESLDLIQEQAHRWRTLEIHGANVNQVNQVVDRLPQFAPNLLHTTITADNDLHWVLDQISLKFSPQFLSYPQFSSLHLEIWELPAFEANHPNLLVLRTLTNLSITDIFAATFSRKKRPDRHPVCGGALSAFLSLCTSLQTFVYDARDSVERHSNKCCQDSTKHNPDRTVTLPALRDLVLIAHRLDTLTLLSNFAFPALRTAHIEPLPHKLVDGFGPVWRALVQRSQTPPLEALSLFAMEPEDVVWTLERAPLLASLHIEFCTSPTLVLKALTGPHGWLCPVLRRLTFAECSVVPWRTVAKFFKTRHSAARNGDVKIMLALILNGHDVFEERNLDEMAQFKLWHIHTLIEP